MFKKIIELYRRRANDATWANTDLGALADILAQYPESVGQVLASDFLKQNSKPNTKWTVDR